VNATEEFAALVAGGDEGIALDRGALLIAAHFRPGLDVEAQLARLDRLASDCPNQSIDGLRHHLFVAEGFTGNRYRYDDPRNSMLDSVLDRRVGIPISLAVLVLEVGRRLGLELYGVGMPGHFLVGTGDGRFVDPFDGGQVLERAACRQRFHATAGRHARWEPGYLSPTRPGAILARMLANLREIFASKRDTAGLRWVLTLRSAFPDAGAGDRLELAGLLATLGVYDEAARLFDRVAAGHVSTAEAEVLRARALMLRSRLN
jgi:regulator of sirC expression with transglutaminase-like and TPR domain